MDTFNYRAFTVSLVGLICSVFIIILNTRLLHKFRTSPIRNKPEYHLFTIRFIIDICFSLTVSCYYSGLIISYLNPFVLFEYRTLFFITLLSSNFTSIRFLLALLIALERLIAVFFPISFHNNRRRVPILVFFAILFLWGALEDVMYFSICSISPFVKSCSILACTWNDCFINYWTGNKMVIGAFSSLSSFVLFGKLLSVKRMINLNSDLSKTNYLCIVDACLCVLLDFTPFLFTQIFKQQVLSADIYGPYNATAKSIACCIDALIATWILKRTSSRTTPVRSVNPRSLAVSVSERHASSKTNG